MEFGAQEEWLELFVFFCSLLNLAKRKVRIPSLKQVALYNRDVEQQQYYSKVYSQPLIIR